ncbi:hybrid sensor histidine kinase/response regulator [Dyadobacter sandarakinus]|uniref:histidine kinase n=1 Tax=Dyadobacter sandarakinus TaxID=2747268 RepID=A0ABX7I3E1_9BACT|nr:hybrid sensor histidine kinase/response regulator [Dyadobacter sandarakinus]QRQ99555.1 response regulator [Dyadobacter sandarakinus]
MAVFVLIFKVLPTIGQEINYPFRHLSTNSGLSQNNVTSILCDSRGFMWFGTPDGLNIYDGYKFTIYRNDPENERSLGHNYVHALCEDKRGKLWIGTDDAGLSLYNPVTDRFLNFRTNAAVPGSISHNKVTSISMNAKGNLWIGTGGGGINYLDIATKKFTAFRHSPDVRSLSSDFVSYVLVDRKGRVWVATSNAGLNLMTSPKGDFVHFTHAPATPGSLSKNELNALYEDRAGNIWIATEGGGLNRFNPADSTFTVFRHNPDDKRSISHNDVLSIQEDKAGRLWIGTRNGGINILNADGTFDHFVADRSNPDRLNNGSIYTMFCDKNGAMWVGTYSGGINIMDAEPLKFNRLRSYAGKIDGLNNDNILAITEDHAGNLWLGTDGGGINVWDRKNAAFSHYKHEPENRKSIASNYVISLHEDRDKIMWIGNYKGGLSTFNSKQRTFDNLNRESKIKGRIPSNIHALEDDHAGTLWIATSEGLLRYNKASGTYIRYYAHPSKPDGINANVILSLLVDRQDRVWVGTEGGGLNLFQDKTGTFKHYTSDIHDKTTLSSNLVNCIYQDSKNRIWVGTNGGLNLMDDRKGTFTQYRQKDGLPNEVIEGILEDAHGTLWLTTNLGVSNFNPDTRTFRNYDTSDGLQGTSFNRMSVYKNAAGTMFLGGQNGLNVFHPDSIRYNKYVPPVFITDFQVFNKSVSNKDKNSPLRHHITAVKDIRVSHKDLMLSFEFTALNYTITRKNQYAYKLEGFDDDWIMSGTTRRATYTNLDPGDYVFRVKASNNDGVWNETGTYIRLHIVPPFWGTWWFRGVILLLLAGVIFLLYQMRVGAMKKQRKILLQEVKERTKEVILQKQALEIQAEHLHKLNRDLKQKHILEHQAREEAEKANQAKSVFLATMSHEIRTPMNGILGMALLLSQTEMTDEQAEYTETIMSCGDGLLTVINDILDFSKIESGNMELESKTFDLPECIEEVLGVFSGKAALEGLDLVYQINPEVPSRIIGDSLRLRQVLINLVGNAVKFTKKGEILVSVALLSTDEHGEIELQFKVKDSGIGISDDKLDLLFRAFSQVDSSHSRKYGGTGLGLVICRRLVELMGGRIYAESEEEKGATFTFTIMTLPGEPDPAAGTELHRSDSEGKQVLVVDDNRTNLRIIDSQLKYWKLVPALASSGREALEILKSNPKIELVITDQNMPVMNGLDLSRKIRDTYPDIPIVLLSSVGDETRKNYPDIFAAVLTKPVKHQRLGQVIQNELSRQVVAPAPPPRPSLLSTYFAEEFPLKILVTEDNAINEKLFVTVLTKLGYHPTVAHNGLEALNAAREETFDMIFMDVQMPEMDGLDATRNIRKLNIQQPYITAMTANAMHEDREICLKAGMDDYISKPLRHEDIKAALQRGYTARQPMLE